MKIHLLISLEPPRYGTAMFAMCGALVPGAQPIRHDDDEFPRQTVLFCRKCEEKLAERFRYVAWIISGEEGKQLEAGKENYES